MLFFQDLVPAHTKMQWLEVLSVVLNSFLIPGIPPDLAPADFLSLFQNSNQSYEGDILTVVITFLMLLRHFQTINMKSSSEMA